jgi:hypothetical protein
MGDYILFTQYNYEKAFRVEVSGKRISVYKHTWEGLAIEELYKKPSIFDPVFTIKDHMCIYCGYDEHKPLDPFYLGNSLIIRLDKNKYIFVGEFIYAFQMDDVITYFASPMIKEQAFPYFLTNTHCYLLLDNVRIPLNYTGNPYQWYYNGNESKGEEFKYRMLCDNYLAG